MIFSHIAIALRGFCSYFFVKNVTISLFAPLFGVRQEERQRVFPLKLRCISVAKGKGDAFLCRASSDRRTVSSVLALKAISDELYARQERAQHSTTYRDIPIDGCREVSVPSAEEALDHALTLEELERLQAQLERFLDSGLLTGTQRRRFYLYCIHELSTRQIALAEGVRQFAVWKSLQLCQKKFQKFLDKRVVTPPDFLH